MVRVRERDGRWEFGKAIKRGRDGFIYNLYEPVNIAVGACAATKYLNYAREAMGYCGEDYKVSWQPLRPLGF